MNYSLALGSNLGDRRLYLQKALDALKLCGNICRISSVYETQALFPDQVPENWNQNFLNMAINFDSSLQPQQLLLQIKKIEKQLGREKKHRWGPREIDIDILFCERGDIDTPSLKLPHPEMKNRSFVLDPLKDIYPGWVSLARQLKKHQPQWMGIVNLSPDSFSDGGKVNSVKNFLKKMDDWSSLGVHFIDLGGESTRPGASPLSWEEEWQRIRPYLECYKQEFGQKAFAPKISIDTYHFETAQRCAELGVDIINDVSGLSDLRMLDLIKNYDCQYVLMHSLGVPADPQNTLLGNPIKELKAWFDLKIKKLMKNDISSESLIFDPGIGFGKTAQQSKFILENIKDFFDFPCPILVGHSRKSFLGGDRPFAERDLETLGLSLNLANKGVDVLRVHNVEAHIRAYKGWQYAEG